MMSIGKVEGYIEISDDNEHWVSLPTPKNGSGTFEVQTVVDGGRSANGDFIGQAVGSDKCKINCSWSALSDDEFRALLHQFDRGGGGAYVKYVRFWDPRIGLRVTRRMYVGDRKGTPFEVELPSGRPAAWLDVQCNLVEV